MVALVQQCKDIVSRICAANLVELVWLKRPKVPLQPHKHHLLSRYGCVAQEGNGHELRRFGDWLYVGLLPCIW